MGSGKSQRERKARIKGNDTGKSEIFPNQEQFTASSTTYIGLVG